MKILSTAVLVMLIIAPFANLAKDDSLSLDDHKTAESTSQTYYVRLTDSSIPQISAGQGFACSLHLDIVKCWGYGGQGHLGYGDINSQTSPQLVQFGNLQYAIDVSAGSDHACAVMNDNTLYCWGQGQSGKLGSGNSDNYDSPNIVSFNSEFGSSNIVQDVESSYGRTCSILVWGNISCWGSNSDGGLGNGQNFGISRASPYPVSTLGIGRTAVNLSMGFGFSCALLDDGNVSCWGRNDNGQLGDGDPSLQSKNIPTGTYPFGNNQTAVEISSGMYHTCAILTNGSVSCWGYNNYGQIGIGSVGGVFNQPVFISDFGVFNATKIIAGHYSTCAILNNSETFCWGSDENSYGINSLFPVKLNYDSRFEVSSLALSNNHHCSVFTNGYATCWGIGGTGQFGDGTNTLNRENISLDFSDRILIGEVKDTAVERLNTSFRIEGDVFDGFNASNTTFTIDMPNGVNFNPFNQTIYGAPNYTPQTQWGISLGTGIHQRNGTYQLQILADTDSDGIPNTIDTDDDNDGFGDPSDACPTQVGNSTEDLSGCPDNDGDGYSNTGDAFVNDYSQYLDTDQDGFGDNLNGSFGDACPYTYGESTRDRYGCPDSDFDGWSDENDIFPYDSSQWGDWDGDGYGDQLNGIEGDSCPSDSGNSTKDRYGCIDSDGDGWSDDGDDLPQNPTQWRDRDGDGYGDNQEENATMSDAFPADGTQWNDTDEDGHGDNPFGTQGDWFPNDPTRWQDSDQDGIADQDDAFPNEITQWIDTDGDGYGDDANGSNPDAFPNDDTEWFDSDMDGLGDNADAFTFDPTQKVDADGDGMGDNPMGIGADKFPEDATQWGDIDGDGYGDNPNGTNPDAFTTDATQWSDEDGDGYGDNPAGRLYDQFPQNPTQWLDEDGDGLGDNQSGTNADPFLNDFDNDGYNDSIDPLPKLPSPGDLDNDGVLDVNDQFPEDAREWADYDGDGEGDNADTDDDNDGWADTEEVRLGFDPFNSAEEPVDSFEIVIPGTAVGLGAWDLIGMFGGIPLALWIGFGFATRNGRTAKYEGLLREAQTRDELEDVARMWEYSLMLRMLGPHQGIRLERLRAELDDRFEAQNQSLSSIEPQQHDQTQMVEKAMQAEQKSLPSIESAQPEITVQGSPDGKGYEWYTDGQETSWYRNEGSNSEWQRFEA